MVELPGHPYFFVPLGRQLFRCNVDAPADQRCQLWAQTGFNIPCLTVWGQEVWAGEWLACQQPRWMLRIHWVPGFVASTLGVLQPVPVRTARPSPAAPAVVGCRRPATLGSHARSAPAPAPDSGMDGGRLLGCPGHQPNACKDYDL